jgi:hypothetical protein
LDGCPATRSPKALECLCLQGRQYQLESEFLSLPTQDHHSSLNPVARMKKIVRCTFEAAQCYAPTVISPDDLLAVGPSTPLDSNDQLYNLRSMTMSTRPCFPMLAPRSWYTIYSAAPPSGYLLRLSLIAREPQRTVRSPTPVGLIKPSYPYLDYFLRCRALARVLLGLTLSTFQLKPQRPLSMLHQPSPHHHRLWI